MLRIFSRGYGRLAIQGLGCRLVRLAHAHGIDDDEMGFLFGVGRDALQVVGLDDRQPRPFICSKYDAELMFRMNSRHSSGFTSVPVAIISTVTAIRGL